MLRIRRIVFTVLTTFVLPVRYGPADTGSGTFRYSRAFAVVDPQFER